MIDSFVLLAPLLMIPVVALVCFVGCDVVFGLDEVPPAGPAPTGLTATPGDTRIVLSWDAYPDVTKYTIQRGEISGNYTATFTIDKNQTSYTDPTLVNGTTYFYVLTAIAQRESSPSEEVSATPSAAALIPFVSSFTTATIVTTVSGWFGMQIVVGPNPITVKTLGRAFIPGNTQIHIIKLVNAAGADVTNGFTSVSMAGGVDGQFKYGVLTAPTTLDAGQTYFILSQETSGGDGFYNHTGDLTTTDAAVIQSAARGGPPYIVDNAGLHCYGPLSFQY